jgi:hypothetical protein
MMILRLIADDLTGALDTAAQFTGRIAPEGPCALNLSCRDGDQKTAVACTRDSLRCYSGADLAFKKIDSLLRGIGPRSIFTQRSRLLHGVRPLVHDFVRIQVRGFWRTRLAARASKRENARSAARTPMKIGS